jgi:hypothetical protein
MIDYKLRGMAGMDQNPGLVPHSLQLLMENDMASNEGFADGSFSSWADAWQPEGDTGLYPSVDDINSGRSGYSPRENFQMNQADEGSFAGEPVGEMDPDSFSHIWEGAAASPSDTYQPDVQQISPADNSGGDAGYGATPVQPRQPTPRAGSSFLSTAAGPVSGGAMSGIGGMASPSLRGLFGNAGGLKGGGLGIPLDPVSNVKSDPMQLLAEKGMSSKRRMPK